MAAVETDLEHPFKRKEATDIQNRKAWTKMETCICGHSEANVIGWYVMYGTVMGKR